MILIIILLILRIIALVVVVVVPGTRLQKRTKRGLATLSARAPACAGTGVAGYTRWNMIMIQWHWEELVQRVGEARGLS